MRSSYEDPDEDPDEEPDEAVSAALPAVPSVVDHGREWEYRTEMLTIQQVADGETLTARLTAASEEGWDFLQVVDAGERRAILYRKAKTATARDRRMGFAVPVRS